MKIIRNPQLSHFGKVYAVGDVPFHKYAVLTLPDGTKTRAMVTHSNNENGAGVNSELLGTVVDNPTVGYVALSCTGMDRIAVQKFFLLDVCLKVGVVPGRNFYSINGLDLEKALVDEPAPTEIFSLGFGRSFLASDEFIKKFGHQDPHKLFPIEEAEKLGIRQILVTYAPDHSCARMSVTRDRVAS
jgi:hypothetical protein